MRQLLLIFTALFVGSCDKITGASAINAPYDAETHTCVDILETSLVWAGSSVSTPALLEADGARRVYAWEFGEVLVENGFGAQRRYEGECEVIFHNGESVFGINLHSGNDWIYCEKVGGEEPYCETD